MLKYLYTKELFQEIPEEITLGISISGCTIRCPDCHSKELWKDTGTKLTTKELDKLLKQHQGITCCLLLGGEHDINVLIELFKYIRLGYNKKAATPIKTAWYCGLQRVPKDKMDIYHYLDWIKLGPYISELGGLDSPKTNQHLFRLHPNEDKLIIANEVYLYTKFKPFEE